MKKSKIYFFIASIIVIIILIATIVSVNKVIINKEFYKKDRYESSQEMFNITNKIIPNVIAVQVSNTFYNEDNSFDTDNKLNPDSSVEEGINKIDFILTDVISISNKEITINVKLKEIGELYHLDKSLYILEKNNNDNWDRILKTSYSGYDEDIIYVSYSEIQSVKYDWYRKIGELESGEYKLIIFGTDRTATEVFFEID